MRDRTGGSRAYGQPQTGAAARQRFDTTRMLSFLPPPGREFGRFSLLRLRFDDHTCRAGAREGDPGVLDRCLDQRVNSPAIEVRRGLDGNAAHLAPRALEKPLGVG